MTVRTLMSLGLALALAGCAATPPPRPLGECVRRAVAAQTLNPEAGGTEPVAGLDGQAGEQVMQGFRAGFGAEKKAGAADIPSGLPAGGGKQ